MNYLISYTYFIMYYGQWIIEFKSSNVLYGTPCIFKYLTMWNCYQPLKSLCDLRSISRESSPALSMLLSGDVGGPLPPPLPCLRGWCPRKYSPHLPLPASFFSRFSFALLFWNHTWMEKNLWYWFSLKHKLFNHNYYFALSHKTFSSHKFHFICVANISCIFELLIKHFVSLNILFNF